MKFLNYNHLLTKTLYNVLNEASVEDIKIRTYRTIMEFFDLEGVNFNHGNEKDGTVSYVGRDGKERQLDVPGNVIAIENSFRETFGFHANVPGSLLRLEPLFMRFALELGYPTITNSPQLRYLRNVIRVFDMSCRDMGKYRNYLHQQDNYIKKRRNEKGELLQPNPPEEYNIKYPDFPFLNPEKISDNITWNNFKKEMKDAVEVMLQRRKEEMKNSNVSSGSNGMNYTIYPKGDYVLTFNDVSVGHQSGNPKRVWKDDNGVWHNEDFQIPLCFTTHTSQWKNFTQNGKAKTYMILADGWENIPAYDPATGHSSTQLAYDDYGKSMMFFFVDEDGELSNSNTRWNHGASYGSMDVDQAFTPEMIEEILGIDDFYEVFTPLSGESLMVKNRKFTERLDNGESLEDLFSEIEDGYDESEFKHGSGEMYIVKGNKGLMNYVYLDKASGKYKLLLTHWVKKANPFKMGYAKISTRGSNEYYDTYTIINEKGEFIPYFQYTKAYAKMMLKNVKNGRISLDQAFPLTQETNIPNIIIIGFNLEKNSRNDNHIFNLYNKETNSLISPKVWFKRVARRCKMNTFIVETEQPYNKFVAVTTDGQLLTYDGYNEYIGKHISEITQKCLNGEGRFEDYFEMSSADFLNPDSPYKIISYTCFNARGYEVENNNIINIKTGDLLFDKWYHYCSAMFLGYGVVKLDGAKYYYDKNGEIFQLTSEFLQTFEEEFKNNFNQFLKENDYHIPNVVEPIPFGDSKKRYFKQVDCFNRNLALIKLYQNPFWPDNVLYMLIDCDTKENIFPDGRICRHITTPYFGVFNMITYPLFNKDYRYSFFNLRTNSFFDDSTYNRPSYSMYERSKNIQELTTGLSISQINKLCKDDVTIKEVPREASLGRKLYLLDFNNSGSNVYDAIKKEYIFNEWSTDASSFNFAFGAVVCNGIQYYTVNSNDTKTLKCNGVFLNVNNEKSERVDNYGSKENLIPSLNGLFNNILKLSKKGIDWRKQLEDIQGSSFPIAFNLFKNDIGMLLIGYNYTKYAYFYVCKGYNILNPKTPFNFYETYTPNYRYSADYLILQKGDEKYVLSLSSGKIQEINKFTKVISDEIENFILPEIEPLRVNSFEASSEKINEIERILESVCSVRKIANTKDYCRVYLFEKENILNLKTLKFVLPKWVRSVGGSIDEGVAEITVTDENKGDNSTEKILVTLAGKKLPTDKAYKYIFKKKQEKFNNTGDFKESFLNGSGNYENLWPNNGGRSRWYYDYHNDRHGNEYKYKDIVRVPILNKVVYVDSKTGKPFYPKFFDKYNRGAGDEVFGEYVPVKIDNKRYGLNLETKTLVPYNKFVEEVIKHFNSLLDTKSPTDVFGRDSMRDTRNGRRVVSVRGLNGYFILGKTKGRWKIIIPRLFDDANTFWDSKASVEYNGKKYEIDVDGNFYDAETEEPVDVPLQTESKKKRKKIIRENSNDNFNDILRILVKGYR